MLFQDCSRRSDLQQPRMVFLMLLDHFGMVSISLNRVVVILSVFF